MAQREFFRNIPIQQPHRGACHAAPNVVIYVRVYRSSRIYRELVLNSDGFDWAILVLRDELALTCASEVLIVQGREIFRDF